MISLPKIRLLDGPLIPFNPRRRDMVARMAQDLIRLDAAGNERDAIRALVHQGYSAVDVMTVVEDARQVAMQEIVAKEMSKP